MNIPAGNGSKPTILVFSNYYLPGFRAGGALRSISNLVDALGDEFDFRIVALDHDLGERHSYLDIEHEVWVPQGKALVWYVSPAQSRWRSVRKVLRSLDYQLIYLNSFFDPVFTQRVLWNRLLGRSVPPPVVIAPRGEFSEGALGLRPYRKRFYVAVAKMIRLYDGLIWQASSAYEAKDICRLLAPRHCGARYRVLNGSLTIAPDLTSFQSGLIADKPSVAGPLRVCFLSRISPNKNLAGALKILAAVRVPVDFTIYGPAEDSSYWAECKKLIQLLPNNIKVVHGGLVDHVDVVPTLALHDLFLFPTMGENFGHVIHEALSAGLPILISNQTPWRNLESDGVGWDLPLRDLSAYVRVIENVALWSDEHRRSCASRARAVAARVGADPTVIESNRRLFREAIDGTIQSISTSGEVDCV